MTHLRQTRMSLVEGALTDTPQTLRQLGEITGIDLTTLNDTLKDLAREGSAKRLITQDAPYNRHWYKRSKYSWVRA